MGERRFDPIRAVEVIAPRYGSGYRIGGQLILTAAHLLPPEVGAACQVRFRRDVGGGTWDAVVAWLASGWIGPRDPPRSDVALIAVCEEAGRCEPAVLGRLPEGDSSALKLPFDFYGWPKWGQTKRKDKKALAGGRHVDGLIYLADISPEGLLVLEPDRQPESEPGSPESPWEGFSGAAVVCDGLVVGVQRHHQNPRRPGSLEAVRLAPFAADARLKELLAQHGITESWPIVRPDLATAARLTMTSTISDQLAAADHTVRLSAELRPASNQVVVQTAGGPIAEFLFEEDLFRQWQQSLRHQIHGSRRAERESEFVDRAEAMAEKLAVLVGAAELARLVAAVDADPSGTVFLRVELARPELDIIPWELLALPIASRAGARDVCVYRAVRARRRQATPPDPPQRVLLVDSSPLTKQSVNFALERDSIQHELVVMWRAGLVYPDPCPDADPGKLTAALARPTRAVHVAAQGDLGGVRLRQGTKDIKYPGEQFAQFFSQEPQPVAVILSVCDSVPAPPQAPGVARALAEAGVAEVLGMYSVITPGAALEFFTRLYRALGRCSDMATAYAAAVAALRADTYPNRGFWSVPVLYSYDNVIPFPGTQGDPRGSYRRIAGQVERFRAELSGLVPKEFWSENTWRLETMKLRIDADDRRQQLVQLIGLVRPEARSGSKWAAEVSRNAHVGLRALDGVVARVTNPRPGASAVDRFAESKAELTAALDDLHEAISARLLFSR